MGWIPPPSALHILLGNGLKFQKCFFTFCHPIQQFIHLSKGDHVFQLLLWGVAHDPLFNLHEYSSCQANNAQRSPFYAWLGNLYQPQGHIKWDKVPFLLCKNSLNFNMCASLERWPECKTNLGFVWTRWLTRLVANIYIYIKPTCQAAWKGWEWRFAKTAFLYGLYRLQNTTIVLTNSFDELRWTEFD